ncbi:hypothetical protein EJB05_25564 [Eragrostis curvula]|uniref:Rhodanese domain-containing protein n=1 Tax=Eragrostis curvula TaxID=38414 RepID=A0A5J9VE65_9POAL|nr:hypothetical protein EJB05_25564 [Eragrostis curvula]
MKEGAIIRHLVESMHPSLVLNNSTDMYCSCSSESSAVALVTVDVTTARELMASAGHRYLDVRTEEELSKGHLDNSLNVPYMFNTPQGKHLASVVKFNAWAGREKNPLYVEQVASLFSKEEHIVVGCQSGKRSELACVDLLAAGFKNVKNMGGGYAAWLQNGFSVHNPQHTG